MKLHKIRIIVVATAIISLLVCFGFMIWYLRQYKLSKDAETGDRNAIKKRKKSKLKKDYKLQKIDGFHKTNDYTINKRYNIPINKVNIQKIASKYKSRLINYFQRAESVEKGISQTIQDKMSMICSIINGKDVSEFKLQLKHILEEDNFWLSGYHSFFLPVCSLEKNCVGYSVAPEFFMLCKSDKAYMERLNTIKETLIIYLTKEYDREVLLRAIPNEDSIVQNYQITVMSYAQFGLRKTADVLQKHQRKWLLLYAIDYYSLYRKDYRTVLQRVPEYMIA
ncbi:hypothetical protein ECANGB1_1346 [Enterospora canceri]|uniref:Uncharacterized protein n=1 Tax=Enterospora canceri TaxID=1081671 RepID=A0A1Y1S6C9_9MICR|nr:hypothetical protein ECANGB1_1346 [Enterospora canceri]